MPAQPNDSCIIGIERCGCVTFAYAGTTDPLPRMWKEAAAQVVAAGGQVLTTMKADAHAREHFLPVECPHEPRGWVSQ